MEFYVYVYLNPLKPGNYTFDDIIFNYEPFYVGRGKGMRMTAHMFKSTSVNALKQNIINKIKTSGYTPIILKVYDSLTFVESCNKEIDLIRKIGRRDLREGPLSNMTDGGEGTVNRKLKKESLDKMRKIVDVIQFDSNGKILKIWDSPANAAYHIKCNSSHIFRACNDSERNKYRKVHNSYWKYLANETVHEIIDVPLQYKAICQYSLDGKFIREFFNSKDANSEGFHAGHVKICCDRNNKDNSNYKFNEYMWFYTTDCNYKNMQAYNRNLQNAAKIKQTILQINNENVSLKEWTLSELRDNNFVTKTILMCCKNKLKKSQGFSWKFKNN
ncbi:MAG: hypothetical protein WC979_01135 [Candidatus Pacearchaeota archaeon]|jgi:hypothetical protein|nr:hypothetical protein [Clostridia bacterium]